MIMNKKKTLTWLFDLYWSHNCWLYYWANKRYRKITKYGILGIPKRRSRTFWVLSFNTVCVFAMFSDLPTGFGTYGVQDVHAKPSSEACSTSSSVYRLSQTAWTHLHRHTETEWCLQTFHNKPQSKSKILWNYSWHELYINDPFIACLH